MCDVDPYAELIASPEKIDAKLAVLNAERKKLMKLRQAAKAIRGQGDEPFGTTEG